MKFKYLIVLLLMCVTNYAQNSKVTGVISSLEFNNEPLPFANLIIKGTSIGTTTGFDGKYFINIASGNYILVIAYIGQKTKEISFSIKENETKIINQTLEPETNELENVVISHTVSKERESALLLDQLKAAEIKQSIGAQEMSRKGVSNVESGLTKITGITKVESRGLFVRGLEDRYNTLLINNLAVPSNSPFKKIIPLDLFPTDIVSYMDVFKTFNPNLYGDFAGATIDIKTTQPTKSLTKINYGVSYVTNNNFVDFLISNDGHNAKSFFGFGSQERSLPNQFGNIPNGQINNSFNSTWDVSKITAPVNTSFGFTHFDRFKLEDKPYKMSYFISANLDNKYQFREGVDRTFVTGLGVYDNNLSKKQYKFSTQASALFSLNFSSDRLKITTNALFIKATDNQIQDQIGYTRNAVQNPNEIIRLNQYEESNYFSNQILSEYKLTTDEKHTLKGGLSYTKTKFNQPDRKFINGTVINNEEVEVRFGSNNFIRQYLDVENNFHMSGILEYNYKFGKNQDRQNKLTFGYNGYVEFMKTSYRFISGIPNNTSLPNSIVNLNSINAFIENAIANNYISFREETGGEYKTKIFNRVDGLYFNYLLNVGNKLETNIGLRAENTIRELKFRTISDPIGSVYRKNDTNKLDFLPSLNLKYSLSDNKNIRFAASRTITRPVLFESLPITYVNADGTSEKGNANLKNSINNNVDLKFEISPSNNEIIAVTTFAKYIKNPIERSFDNFGGGSGQQISYYNNKSATLFGVEFEYIIQLKKINQNLEGFSFGFNTSLMHTNAKADTERTSYFDTFKSRKLQGASNWLVNADLKYEFDFNEKWKNTATLVYSVFGERIYAVGIAGLDHVYEKPFHKLDLIWTQNINKKFDVKFSLDNILNPYYKRTLGNNSNINISESSLTVQDYKKGTGVSLGVSYQF